MEQSRRPPAIIEGRKGAFVTSKQRENFERELTTTEIMLTGNEDYCDAQDKAEREIMRKMEMDGFQMVEF